MTQRQEFIEDLKRLHSDELSSTDFGKKYLNPDTPDENDKLLPYMNGLTHYLESEEERLNDPMFARMQKSELGKLIRLLEQNAPLGVIQGIHFEADSAGEKPAGFVKWPLLVFYAAIAAWLIRACERAGYGIHL